MGGELVAAFDAIFGVSRNGMVLADSERRYRDVNTAATTLLRYPREALLRRQVEDLAPPETRHALVSVEWPRFLRNGIEHGRRIMVLGDGTRLDVEYCRTANVFPDRHLGIYIAAAACPPAEHPGHERGQLTRRQTEVVSLLAMGLSGEEIATRLHLSPETVRTHIRDASRNLGAHTRAHLIALALTQGAITID